MMRKSEDSNKYYLKLAAIPGLENVDKKLFIQTNYQIGINYSNMRKPKESIEYLNKLLQYPEFQGEFTDAYISVFYVLGINSYSEKDYNISIEQLSKFLELAKDSSAHSAMIPVAYSFLGSSHFIPLRKEVEKIIEKDQSKAVELAKKKNEIETCLSKAIELSPNAPQMEDAYKDLGLYYFYCEELDKAIDMYKKLIEIYPSSKNLSAYKKFLESVEKEAEAKSKK
jgi:tetratricopeptide (TPR) repeat protein